MENIVSLILLGLSHFAGSNVTTLLEQQQNMCIVPTEAQYCNDENYKNAATRAILEEMEVWTSPEGIVTYATSCRNQPGGCEAHIAKVVDIIFDISCESNFDPFMVMAIAKHESNFNPFIQHRNSKATGLLQLMPRSPFAKGIRFIHNRQFRESCRNHETYCQEEILHASFRLLYRSIARCGSLNRGLGMYGSGSCTGSRDFARYVDRYGSELEERTIRMNERILTNDSTSN